MGKNGYADAMQMPSSTNGAGSAAGNTRDADSFSLGHVFAALVVFSFRLWYAVAKRWREVACGCGEFSLAAAGLAREIHCLDLDADRLLPGLKNCPNVVFDQMDAAAMTYPANCFDIVVLYNALAHVELVLDPLLEGCLRVLKPEGCMLLLSSFKMDKAVMTEKLLPLLQKKHIAYRQYEKGAFTCIETDKMLYGG